MSLELDELRRLAAERLLAQLRRAPRQAERPIDGGLVGRVGQRLERRDVGGRAGRAHERGAEAAGAATTSSTGTPSTVTPTARRSPCSITATIWGSAAKRSSSEDGSAAAQTTASRSHASRQRRTSPAASPSSAAAMPPTSSQARSSSSPRCGRGSASRASASSSRASVFGPMPRTVRRRPAAAASRSSSGGADAERPRDLDRAFRAEPEIAPEADERRGELALELGQLLDLARLDELAQPRLDPRADPAQLAHPPVAHELGDGTGVARIVSAARR